MAQRARRWSWTLNNYTEEEQLSLDQAVERLEDLDYLIYGIESGVEGTPHLQGYLEVAKKLSFQRVKELIGLQRLHLEASKGSQKQNLTYCKKDGNWKEFGEKKNQGKRGDLQLLQEDIQNGMTYREVSQIHFSAFLRYGRAIKEYIAIQVQEETPAFSLAAFAWNCPYPEGHTMILWGDPGIGKTEYAKSLLGGKYLFVSHLDQLSTFDPVTYSGGIIFDDMSFLHLPRESQIALADWDNPRAIHIRYGIAVIPKGTKKIFTTNVENGAIFDTNDGAIKRRLKITHLLSFQ